ncbi:hypothetical protein ACLOJK_021613 [Asimina triloba]
MLNQIKLVSLLQSQKMAVFGVLPLIFLIQPCIFGFASATTIEIHSQVSYTVWSSSVGGEHHVVDQSWTMTMAPASALSHGRSQGNFPMSCGDGRYRYQGHRKPSKVMVDLMVSKPDQYHGLSTMMDGLNIPNLVFSPATDSVPMSYVAPEASAVYAHAPSFRKKSDAYMQPAGVQKMIRRPQTPAVWY